MTRLDTLKSLQSRIREATGADRDLDAEICAVLRYGHRDECSGFLRSFPVWRVKEYGRVEVIDDSGSPGPWFTCAELTTYPDGLGACVGLMRNVLPGCEWEREFRNFGIYNIRTSEGSWHEIGYSTKPLANDCLTFIDAIISAEISKLEAEQEKERAG